MNKHGPMWPLRRSTILMATAALAAGASFGSVSHSVGMAQAKAPRIACVDIDRVIGAYPAGAARERKLIDLRDRVNAEISAIDKQIVAAEGRVDGLMAGTDERRDAELAFEFLLAKKEVTVKRRTDQVQNVGLALKAELYSEICEGIEAFAQKSGIDLVLRTRLIRSGARRNDVLDLIQSRDLLYNSKAVDETEALILFMKGWTPPPKSASDGAKESNQK